MPEMKCGRFAWKLWRMRDKTSWRNIDASFWCSPKPSMFYFLCPVASILSFPFRWSSGYSNDTTAIDWHSSDNDLIFENTSSDTFLHWSYSRVHFTFDYCLSLSYALILSHLDHKMASMARYKVSSIRLCVVSFPEKEDEEVSFNVWSGWPDVQAAREWIWKIRLLSWEKFTRTVMCRDTLISTNGANDAGTYWVASANNADKASTITSMQNKGFQEWW